MRQPVDTAPKHYFLEFCELAHNDMVPHTPIPLSPGRSVPTGEASGTFWAGKRESVSIQPRGSRTTLELSRPALRSWYLARPRSLRTFSFLSPRLEKPFCSFHSSAQAHLIQGLLLLCSNCHQSPECKVDRGGSAIIPSPRRIHLAPSILSAAWSTQGTSAVPVPKRDPQPAVDAYLLSSNKSAQVERCPESLH